MSNTVNPTNLLATTIAAVKATSSWCADDCVVMLQGCSDVTTLKLPVRMSHLQSVIETAIKEAQ